MCIRDRAISVYSVSGVLHSNFGVHINLCQHDNDCMPSLVSHQTARDSILAQPREQRQCSEEGGVGVGEVCVCVWGGGGGGGEGGGRKKKKKKEKCYLPNLN